VLPDDETGSDAGKATISRVRDALRSVPGARAGGLGVPEKDYEVFILAGRTQPIGVGDGVAVRSVELMAAGLGRPPAAGPAHDAGQPGRRGRGGPGA
jgi:hypothetical protein